jgi:hypothetical protein
MEKVLAVRQQLVEGRYDLDKRLDVALDRLLETIAYRPHGGPFIFSNLSVDKSVFQAKQGAGGYTRHRI